MLNLPKLDTLYEFDYPRCSQVYIMYDIMQTIHPCAICCCSHFKLCHFVYIPYITHLIYCTRYHLLHLAHAVLYHHSFIPLCTYYFSLYTCVYKVVVLELLDYSLVITALSELEAQAFRYTRINIC